MDRPGTGQRNQEAAVARLSFPRRSTQRWRVPPPYPGKHNETSNLTLGAAGGWPHVGGPPGRAGTGQRAGWRTFETVTRLEISPPTGAVQAWVPLPLSQDTDWFQTLKNSVSGKFEKSRTVVEPLYRAAMVVATFKLGEQQPVLEVTSRFRTRTGESN